MVEQEEEERVLLVQQVVEVYSTMVNIIKC
jgi:hypothetical protein